MTYLRPLPAVLRLPPSWLALVLFMLAGAWAKAVTMHPQTERPFLLSGPADKETIKQRLAVFAHPVSSILNAYLNGSEAQKQTASNNFLVRGMDILPGQVHSLLPGVCGSESSHQSVKPICR